MRVSWIVAPPASAGEGWMIFAIAAMSTPAFVLTPTLRGAMSKLVTEEKQGQLQGIPF